MKKTLALLRYEFELDLRDEFSLGGSVLYALIVSFLCLIGMPEPTPEVWLVLFWIMVFFCSLISASYRFQREAKWHRLYFYQLMPAESLLLFKMVVQFLMSLLLSCLIFVVMSVMSYQPIDDLGRFVLLLCGALVCLSGVLCFSSVLSSLVDGGAVILALLSLPLLIPVFVLLTELSGMVAGSGNLSNFGKYLMYMLSIGAIAVAGAYLIIGSVWRN